MQKWTESLSLFNDLLFDEAIQLVLVQMLGVYAL
jgi:hypothetical protein